MPIRKEKKKNKSFKDWAAGLNFQKDEVIVPVKIITSHS